GKPVFQDGPSTRGNNVPDQRELLVLWWAWCSLIIVPGLPILGIWLYMLWKHQHLFPPLRQWAVAWNGLDVLIIFFLVLILIPAFCEQLLDASGFYPWLYGPQWPPPGAKPLLEEAKQFVDRKVLWRQVVAYPLDVIAILLILRGTRGLRLYQLGLHTGRLRENFVSGFMTWLMFTAVVFSLELFVVWCYKILGGQVAEHPLTRLFQDKPIFCEKVAIVFLATVAAP